MSLVAVGGLGQVNKCDHAEDKHGSRFVISATMGDDPSVLVKVYCTCGARIYLSKKISEFRPGEEIVKDGNSYRLTKAVVQ